MSYEDIKHYKPTNGERFFVDANVWYWTTYVSSKLMNLPNAPSEYQTDHYPEFIQRALDAGAELFVTPFILAELASIIEHTEFEIYRQWNPASNINKKRFRKDKVQRLNVVKEIELAWNQVNSIARCMDVSINNEFVTSCMSCLKTSSIDGYDSFHVNAAVRFGLSNLLTDDKDFRTLNGVKVFTTYPS